MRVGRMIVAAMTATAVLAPASAAGAGRTLHMKTDVFAALIGSTSGGGSVYAGSAIDRTLGHGAIVFSSTAGTTKVKTIIHEYYALGSMSGSGTVLVSPSPSGTSAVFTATVKVTSGTGAYRGAHGKLTASGSLNSQNMVTMKVRGTVIY